MDERKTIPACSYETILNLRDVVGRKSLSEGLTGIAYTVRGQRATISARRNGIQWVLLWPCRVASCANHAAATRSARSISTSVSALLSVSRAHAASAKTGGPARAEILNPHRLSFRSPLSYQGDRTSSCHSNTGSLTFYVPTQHLSIF